MELFKQLNEAKLHSRIHFEGLDISVEVPAGGYRRGVNKKTGEAWAHKIPDAYGYIKGTHSPDGEHLDCYLRKNPKKGAKVYVMHQLTVDGSRFDEDKVMLGYSSKSEAIKAFKEVTFKPTTMYGGCTEFDMEHFQVIAFSASKSKAMLTNNQTFDEFKKKGLITGGIKSPIQVAKKVSESLQEGLAEINEVIYKGDLVECLDWSGYHEGAPVEAVLARSYGHYQNTPYMHERGKLSEAEFHELVLNYIMEQDALLTDVEDQLDEEIAEDLGHFSDIGDDALLDDIHRPTVEQEELEEDPIVEANNFTVVVHTQIMENIGTAENPSWATAGSRVQLVQEGFATYGEARALAAKVSAGEHPIDIAEGAYVLGIDVMPTGEYRQFHEAVEEEETVEEDTTDEVFFQQQVMEARKLAGIRDGSFVNEGTPTVHETRARLEELSKDFYEAIEEQAQANVFPADKLDEAAKLYEHTSRANPTASPLTVAKAICSKVYSNVALAESMLEQVLDRK